MRLIQRLTRDVVLLPATLAAAFWVRWRCAHEIFFQHWVFPYGPDSGYHLWRIERAVWDGKPPRFDPFLNAPEGARVIYPDGFDAAIAAVVRLLHGSSAERRDVQETSFLVMLVLGVLAVLAAWYLARRVIGRRAALVAAAVAAVLPVHVAPSIIGRVDHHVLELALPSLILCCLWHARPERPRRRLLRASSAGVLLATMVYTIPAVLMHVGIVAAGVAAAALRASWSGKVLAARAILMSSAAASLIAAGLALPDALTRSGFAFYAPSLLPLAVLAALVAAAAGMGLLAARGWWPLVAAMAGIGTCAAAALLLFPGGLGFVSRAGVIGLIEESKPLWQDPEKFVRFHSLLLFALPFAFWLVARERGTPAAFGLAAIGAAGFCLVVMQQRFGVVLAIPAAAAIAGLCVTFWRTLTGRARIVFAVILGVAFAPAVQMTAEVTTLTPRRLALFEVADWLANETPEAGERVPPNQPLYSVLTIWGDGAQYAYFARRPMVVGAFYHGDHEAAFLDSINALFRSEEPTEILQRRRVRYIVVSEVSPWSLFKHQELLGIRGATAPPFHERLYGGDGAALARDRGAAAGGVLPALGRYRLVHEAPVRTNRGSGEMSAAKVFERVPGALLTGPCNEDGVLLSIEITTDLGRKFEYWDRVRPADGRFAVRVPYSGTFAVRLGPRRTVRVDVREQDVLEGHEVEIR